VDCPPTEGATTRGAERTLGGAEGTVRVDGAAGAAGTVRVGVAAGADLVCACTGVGLAAPRPVPHTGHAPLPWPARTRSATAICSLFEAFGLWTLYWRNRNLKYHRYQPLDPSPRVQDLLDYLDKHADPIFWG